MNNLRWILLGVAIAIIIAIYLFGRARKRDQSYASICAASEIPAFNAEDEDEPVDENGWTDGVSPVRVVSNYLDDAVIEPVENMTADTGPTDLDMDELVVDNTAQDFDDISLDNGIKETPEFTQSAPETVSSNTPGAPAQNKHDLAIDDVISVYVLAKKDNIIKGDDILRACRSLRLEYGDMKIFHRHELSEEGKILFSMASIQEPGWFEIEAMDEMETTGLSFFMQANLVDNPSSVLDDMLVCAHGLASLLGATLCNSHRKIL